MIVRIMTEDQYRLDESQMDAVKRLDDALEAALDKNDAAGFQSTLQQLVELVRSEGQQVAIDEVVPSDLIVPAPDMSLDEAKERLHTVEAKTQAAE
jgi:predicted transcriptional regulator